MKDTTKLGLKLRYNPQKNYEAVFRNGITIRFDLGDTKELEPDQSEFYDVGIGTKCETGKCKFCYVSANSSGRYFNNICETWKSWMESISSDRMINGIKITKKPFSIAIGSTCEPTEHPDFCKFLKVVHETGVIPNYTTNGVILGTKNDPRRNKILDYTEKYCMGVAVSFGNPDLKDFSRNTINLLGERDIHICIHHIISDPKSVDDFIKISQEYGNKILYHVLLPLTVGGRSKSGINPGTWEYLEKKLGENKIENVSFGAKFIKYLENSCIDTWLFPEETYSKNILIDNYKITITPSSFDLKPIKILCMKEHFSNALL